MPAIPGPTMQTSALIFLSSAGIDGSVAVADQSDPPSSEIGELCDTDRTARRRECTCAIAFSPDIQLLPTTINDDRTMGQSAARDSQNPEAASHRGEFVSSLNSLLSKSRFEDSPHRWCKLWALSHRRRGGQDRGPDLHKRGMRKISFRAVEQARCDCARHGVPAVR